MYGPLNVKCKEVGILYLGKTVPNKLNSCSYRLSKTPNAHAAPVKFNAISRKEKGPLDKKLHSTYSISPKVPCNLHEIFPPSRFFLMIKILSVCSMICVTHSSYHSSNGLLLQSININVVDWSMQNNTERFCRRYIFFFFLKWNYLLCGTVS